MHKLVVIDLSDADISKFEDYEKKVIPLLHKYGARMEQGFRSVDGASETHVLYFPDTESFNNFLSDPVRVALQDDWNLAGAVPAVTDVKEVSYLD